MKNLLNFCAVVLGIGALGMTFMAIWGTEPVRWGLTAVITGIGAAVAFTAGDAADDPLPRVREPDRTHHLY